MYPKAFAIAITTFVAFSPTIIALPTAETNPAPVPETYAAFRAAAREILVNDKNLGKRDCNSNGCKTCIEQCTANPYGTNLGGGLCILGCPGGYGCNDYCE
ncbi:MAG: hypothetical protein HETSPECPRED_002373 [Heterodermia speciosa]|uniref:Effector protein n=1 Tax=Heterodermia speciosa TaxID=116794 RepID=A0A8H3J3Z2_9LECA|nr:MAG: hypothetical protein HETSPECPRED_002373 [Heterodermia speciosa]